jgi:hypothetical protein
VTVRYKPGIVEYLSAVPNTGFTIDIEQQTPEVEVEFTSAAKEIEVRVRWNEGELDVDINEN